MSTWKQNESTPSARRCDLRVQKSDGTLAPRGTDFMALGYVYICGVNSPHLDVALGTMTNKRKSLDVPAFAVTATDTVNDRLAYAGHDLETGDGPIRPLSTIGGLVAGNPYYAIYYSADEFSLATSPALAYAGTKVDITADVGALGIEGSTDTRRGIDGLFTYEATPGETNHGAPESMVIVDGPNYEVALGFGGITTVEMPRWVWGEASVRDGVPMGDLLRLAGRSAAAIIEKNADGTYVIKTLLGLDSHGGQVTDDGRIDIDIIDAS
jgi:hypothetical protein